MTEWPNVLDSKSSELSRVPRVRKNRMERFLTSATFADDPKGGGQDARNNPSLSAIIIGMAECHFYKYWQCEAPVLTSVFCILHLSFRRSETTEKSLAGQEISHARSR